jgi:TonB-linked SusC/RagA family outer membrane protein
MYKIYTHKPLMPWRRIQKPLLVMKLTTLILIAAIIQVSAASFAQKITLKVKKASLESVFKEIHQQSNYDFFFDRKLIQQAEPVTVDLKNATLKEALNSCLANQMLTYKIEEQTVIVREKIRPEESKLQPTLPSSIKVSGTIADSTGAPLAGASVLIKGKVSVADRYGQFTVVGDAGDLVTITYVGFKPFYLTILQDMPAQHIVLHPIPNRLNEVVLIGYGTTTKRLNTGNVSSIKAVDIDRQPVSNPLLALEGQVPGLIVTQGSGINGSGVFVQLRGQNSLIQGSDPLFIIDGVPFSSGNAPLNQLVNASGDGSSNTYGLSPFNLINPADIESIDILKDADATAIYGSRGANGVILITTKKGKAGRTVVNANIYTGVSRTTRTMDMLTTQQYLQMRHEAFRNDGITPDASSAPDLTVWDTTRYTDFKKLLIGNTAHTTDGQLSISGGNENTQFMIGGGFHKQTTVFPTDKGDTRASVHANLNHTSADRKLQLNFSSIYSSDINNLPSTDLTSLINTTPNLKLYDGSGKLNWQDGGVSFYDLGLVNSNPLAFGNQTYTGKFQNLNSNLQLSYKPIPELTFKVNLGYNNVNSDEISLHPSTSIDPFSGLLPFSNFAKQTQQGWIIEPQAEFIKNLGKSKLAVLVGNTWQDNTSEGIVINANDYSSDLLLSSVAAASYAQTTNSYRKYRYDGLYGRINYNVQEKYIFTLSGRRDGSSRFGPANRFSNFGALGAAWIFSEENFVQNSLPFISFGKIRSSYGVTGNDQIGDYKYLDSWVPGTNTYQGTSVLNPTSLYNPAYSWEKNKKAEVAMDLGFFRDRLLFSVSYYNNRSDNQLINYTLPTQTGFYSVLKNLNANIRNTGWEFQVNSKNLVTGTFNWSTSLNVTIPQNKLLSFPGLSTSSYSSTYVEGQSLSTRRFYQYQGVDPTTGIYQFLDADHNGVLNDADKTVLKSTDPKFYGGLQNSFRYKGLELSVFFEFKKQNGYNYLSTLASTVPGYYYFNQPTIVLGRWQKPGDQTNIQQFTSQTGTAFTAGSNYLTASDAIISDASYIRCKNVALSYSIPNAWLTRFHITGSRIFIQGQNLFTITNYTGADPETQNIYVLPPLKTITAGFQLTL